MPPRHEASSAVSTRHQYPASSSQHSSLRFRGVDHEGNDGVRISANDDDDDDGDDDDDDDDFGEFENAMTANLDTDNNAIPTTTTDLPPSPDIYAALDQLEMSLDAELEDLIDLGYLKTSFELECHEGIDSSSAIPNDDAQLNHDDHEMSHEEDEDNGTNSKEEEEDSNCEERMMLLPPPPSWFRLDDQYIIAPVTSNSRKHDCHNDNSTTIEDEIKSTIESTKSDRKNETAIDTSIQPTDKSPSASRASADSIESENRTIAADSFPAPIVQSNSFHNETIDTRNLARSSSSPKPSPSPSQSQSTPTAMALAESLESILHRSARTASRTVPTALREYSSSAIRRSVRALRLEYARSGPAKRYARASDIGNTCGRGYYLPHSFRNEFRNDTDNGDDDDDGGGVVVVAGDVVAARKNGRSRDGHLDWMRASDGTEVRFTTLPWIERQLVHEWRTYEWSSDADLK